MKNEILLSLFNICATLLFIGLMGLITGYWYTDPTPFQNFVTATLTGIYLLSLSGTSDK
jgi:hypothetical protein